MEKKREQRALKFKSEEVAVQIGTQTSARELSPIDQRFKMEAENLSPIAAARSATYGSVNSSPNPLTQISISDDGQPELRNFVLQTLQTIKEEQSLISERLNSFQIKQAQTSSDAPLFQSEGQPKVIIRSPFEQEMIELLAHAATQPRTDLNYLQTNVTPRVLRSEQEEVQKQEEAPTIMQDSESPSLDMTESSSKLPPVICYPQILDSVLFERRDILLDQGLIDRHEEKVKMHHIDSEILTPLIGLEGQNAPSSAVTSVVIDKADQNVHGASDRFLQPQFDEKRKESSKKKLFIQNQSYLIEDLLSPASEKLPTELSAGMTEKSQLSISLDSRVSAQLSGFTDPQKHDEQEYQNYNSLLKLPVNHYSSSLIFPLVGNRENQLEETTPVTANFGKTPSSGENQSNNDEKIENSQQFYNKEKIENRKSQSGEKLKVKLAKMAKTTSYVTEQKEYFQHIPSVKRMLKKLQSSESNNQFQARRILPRSQTLAFEQQQKGATIKMAFPSFEQEIQKMFRHLPGEEIKSKTSEENQSEDSDSTNASYYNYELDQFNFHNLSFSIVKRQHLDSLEAKWINNNTWKNKIMLSKITRIEQMASTAMKISKKKRKLAGKEGNASIHMLLRSNTLTTSLVQQAFSSILKQADQMESSESQPYLEPVAMKRYSSSIAPEQVKREQLASQKQHKQNIFTTLKDIPIPQDCKVHVFKQQYKSKECINIKDGSDMSKKLPDLKYPDLLDTSVIPSPVKVSLQRSLKHQQTTTIDVQQDTKWLGKLELAAFLLDGLKKGVEVTPRKDDPGFFLENEQFESIVNELKQRGHEETKDKSTPEQSMPNVVLIKLLDNDLIMMGKLFTKSSFKELKNLHSDGFNTKNRFQKSYIDYLLGLMSDLGYTYYSQYLWNVSQGQKYKYVNQGIRAIGYFQESVKYNPKIINDVAWASRMQMQAFMRKTISEEIQDILFQKSSQLLLDPKYVKRAVQPLIIEKLREAIQKTCKDDNFYQYYQRMQELDTLKAKSPVFNTHHEKLKAHIQLSKMLIFINFHPRNDEKRWIRQDYMDSLKKSNAITPRLYPNYDYGTRPRFNSNTGTSANFISVKISNDESSDNIQAGSQKSLTPRVMNILRSAQVIKDGFSGELQNKFADQNQKKPFPFKLNDDFGYVTILLKDGCYLILTPARPPRKVHGKKPSVDANFPNNTTSFSNLPSQPDDSVDRSSMTFYDSHMKQQFTDTSFGKGVNNMAQSDNQNQTAISMQPTPKKASEGPEEVRNQRTAFNNLKSQKIVSEETRLLEDDSPKVGIISKKEQTPKEDGDRVIIPIKKTQGETQTMLQQIYEEISQHSSHSSPKQDNKDLTKIQIDACAGPKLMNQHNCEDLESYRIKVSDVESEFFLSFDLSVDEKADDKIFSEQIQQRAKDAGKQEVGSGLIRSAPKSKKNNSVDGQTTGSFHKFSQTSKIDNPQSFTDQSTPQINQDDLAQLKRQKLSSSENFQKKLAMYEKNMKQVKIQQRNISISNISSFDELHDVRVSTQMRRKLALLGLNTDKKGASNQANTSQVSLTNQSPSPVKQDKAYAKMITVVKPVRDVTENQKQILQKIERAKYQYQQPDGSFRFPIHLQTDSSQKDLKTGNNFDNQLAMHSLQKEQSSGEDQTDQQQNSKIPSRSKLSKMQRHDSEPVKQTFLKTEVMQKQFQNTVSKVNKKEVDILKYQVVKSKVKKNMFRTKSPETRAREKETYAAQIEQQEINKVFQAIEQNQIQVVEAFIKSHMFGVNVFDAYGNSLLSVASQFGCYEICRMLIKEGAEVNTQNATGNTPLHYAIAYNMASICEILIESGADETIKNQRRKVPWQGI